MPTNDKSGNGEHKSLSNVATLNKNNLKSLMNHLVSLKFKVWKIHETSIIFNKIEEQINIDENLFPGFEIRVEFEDVIFGDLAKSDNTEIEKLTVDQIIDNIDFEEPSKPHIRTYLKFKEIPIYIQLEITNPTISGFYLCIKNLTGEKLKHVVEFYMNSISTAIWNYGLN